jgi:hypothetical protein
MTGEDILMFCYKPRTVKEMATHFNVPQRAVAQRLRKLIADQRIIRRTTDQGKHCMKQWYMTLEVPQNPALLAKKYSLNVLGVWI